MVATVAMGAILGPGCSKKPGATTEWQAPGDAAGASDYGADSRPPEIEHDDAIGGLQSRLSELEQGLLDAGVDLPEVVQRARIQEGSPIELGATATTTDPATRCERICQLATTICELRDDICALADEHPTDARYARVCERSTLDCERARNACEDCDV